MIHRVYLDACCLSRPYDDQSQERIRFETDALWYVFGLHQHGDVHWVSSQAVIDELLQNKDEKKRAKALELARRANETLNMTESMAARASSLASVGVTGIDALHLAAAEHGQCAMLLTTDDRFIRRAKVLHPPRSVKVQNPVVWVSSEWGKP